MSNNSGKNNNNNMNVLRLNQNYNQAKITDQNNNKCCGGTTIHILLFFLTEAQMFLEYVEYVSNGFCVLKDLIDLFYI